MLARRVIPAARGLLARPTPRHGHGLATVAASRPPTAVLLLNMGGPASLEAVHPFLQNLFSDPDLIPLPFQSRLGPIIAKRRTPMIQKQYAEIGGGSPILEWTRKQGAGMARLLDEIAPESAPHKAYIAFRYVPPSTESAVLDMLRDGVKRVVVFTQYPQYSCSTTGSSLNELHRAIKAAPNTRQSGGDSGVTWSVIDRWGDDADLAAAFACRIRASLNLTSDPVLRARVPILFSAHGLPLESIERGDTYANEVAATAHRVMQALAVPNPFRVAWQSKVGPKKWLTPNTEHVLLSWARQGVKEAIVVPIAFTSDHVETLYELDLEYLPTAKEAGMVGVRRAESLNDMPEFIHAMANVVARHLRGVESGTTPALSLQANMQCHECTKQVCREAKDFFSQ